MEPLPPDAWCLRTWREATVELRRGGQPAAWENVLLRYGQMRVDRADAPAEAAAQLAAFEAGVRALRTESDQNDAVAAYPAAISEAVEEIQRRRPFARGIKKVAKIRETAAMVLRDVCAATGAGGPCPSRTLAGDVLPRPCRRKSGAETCCSACGRALDQRPLAAQSVKEYLSKRHGTTDVRGRTYAAVVAVVRKILGDPMPKTNDHWLLPIA